MPILLQFEVQNDSQKYNNVPSILFDCFHNCPLRYYTECCTRRSNYNFRIYNVLSLAIKYANYAFNVTFLFNGLKCIFM